MSYQKIATPAFWDFWSGKEIRLGPPRDDEPFTTEPRPSKVINNNADCVHDWEYLESSPSTDYYQCTKCEDVKEE